MAWMWHCLPVLYENGDGERQGGFEEIDSGNKG